MSPSAVVEEQVFTEIKRLSFSGLDEMSLLREVITRLQRVVPFDAYCGITIDPLSGLITGMVDEGLGGEEDGHFFFEHVYFEDEAPDFNRMARDRQPVALLSEATGGNLERSLRWRELQRPLGLGHEAHGVLTVDRRFGAASARYGGSTAPTLAPAKSPSCAVSFRRSARA